jgi:hypothetical protein
MARYFPRVSNLSSLRSCSMRPYNSLHNPEELIKIFKATLDFSLLGSIAIALCESLQGLDSAAVAAVEPCNVCARTLVALTSAPRFSFTYSCLSAPEKQAMVLSLDMLAAAARNLTEAGLCFDAETVARWRALCV